MTFSANSIQNFTNQIPHPSSEEYAQIPYECAMRVLISNEIQPPPLQMRLLEPPIAKIAHHFNHAPLVHRSLPSPGHVSETMDLVRFAIQSSLHESARTGNIESQFAVGCAHALGLGTPKNHVKAIACLLQSAVQGHRGAYRCLLWVQRGGIQVASEVETTGSYMYKQLFHVTCKHVHQSALKGDTEARFQIARACALGLNTKKDPILAAKWLRLAANEGHPRAQYRLGIAHLSGRGVRKVHPQTAYQWIWKAAIQKHSEAQFGVAWMTGNGIGTPRKIATSQKWLHRAATLGHPLARAALLWKPKPKPNQA